MEALNRQLAFAWELSGATSAFLRGKFNFEMDRRGADHRRNHDTPENSLSWLHFTQIGTAGAMSFTDDFPLTVGASASGARYYRVEVVR